VEDAPEVPVLEVPVLEVPVLEVPVLEVPVLEVPVLEVPELEVPELEVPELEVRCWGTATGCGAAGSGATAVGGAPPSSADRSICSPQASVSATREAGRPCRIGCAQELQNSLMPLRGTPQDPSPAELSTFLIACYKPGSPPGARSGWAPVGVAVRTPVLSPAGWIGGPGVLG
jgi:hypothetical protein